MQTFLQFDAFKFQSSPLKVTMRFSCVSGASYQTQERLLLHSDTNPLRTQVLSELMSEPDHGSARPPANIARANLCKTRRGWDEALGQAAARRLRLQMSSCKPPGTGHSQPGKAHKGRF